MRTARRLFLAGPSASLATLAPLPLVLLFLLGSPGVSAHAVLESATPIQELLVIVHPLLGPTLPNGTTVANMARDGPRPDQR